MLIATWNVNSVKARTARLLAWLEKYKPDALCLQELKCIDTAFPHEAVKAAGYHAAVHGQKTYNGVAILTRIAATEVKAGLGDDDPDPQARLLSAGVNGVRVISAYVPNGSVVGSDKWEYKLRWLGRLMQYLDRECTPGEPLALCGDINIAPDDLDVARPDEWADTVLCHPDARAAFKKLEAWGLLDTFRKHHPEGKVYSWWDYRALGFPKNNGLRIDHLLMTPTLAARTQSAAVDRDERKGEAPSDHAPVMVTVGDA